MWRFDFRDIDSPANDPKTDGRSSGSKEHRLNRNVIAWLMVLFFAAFFLASVRPGLDAEKYLRWAESAAAADIQRLPDAPRGPNGIPVFQWSAGPGLILCPMLWLGSSVGLDSYETLAVVGGLSGLLFWVVLFEVLRNCTRCPEKALFCAAIAFIATPLGFYSRSLSSETLSLLPAAILAQQTIKMIQRQRLNWYAISGATGMLLIIKPFLAAFAWPVLVIGYGREVRRILRKRQPSTSFFGATACLSMILAASFAQVGVVNFWMTADPLKSAYDFGDSSFRSLDLMNPTFIMNILADPFHGCFTYHPLVALGLIALFIQLGPATVKRDVVTAGAILLTCFAIVINVWFQGGWQYWWMGTLSFAMRGLILLSLPAIVGVAFFLRDGDSLLRRSLLLLTAGWSVLLLIPGPSNFATWSELIAGQWNHLRQFPFTTIPVGAAIGLLTCLTLGSRSWTTAAILGLIGMYLFDLVIERPPAVTVIAVSLLASLLMMVSRVKAEVIVLPAFGAAMLSFLPLWWTTETKRMEPEAPFTGDLAAAHRNMLSYSRSRPDFKDHADKIGRYLTDQGAELPSVAPNQSGASTHPSYRRFKPIR